jgi:medium-chain acyl-[acyl-carrier-protein] hydrolase
MINKIIFFCLPYAGGSASIYNQWKYKLENYITLFPIELAGRGSRITEPFYADLEAAVEDVFATISKEISTQDYVIFGHSMGALITYELVQKIKTSNIKQPLHVFFSGRKPPHIRREIIYSSLSEQAFEKEIMLLGGTPPELFKYPELKQIFIPILRSDFKLSETVEQRDQISILPYNISILVGKDEEIKESEANQWRKYTSKTCSIHFINGGHFFLLKEADAVTNVINHSLSKYIEN